MEPSGGVAFPNPLVDPIDVGTLIVPKVEGCNKGLEMERNLTAKKNKSQARAVSQCGFHGSAIKR